jgi:hypothetical protein
MKRERCCRMGTGGERRRRMFQWEIGLWGGVSRLDGCIFWYGFLEEDRGSGKAS